MKFGYVRVSSHSQSETRQVEALENCGVERIIVDKASGKDFNRDGWQQLKNFILRDGDELFVTNLDRIGRNKIAVTDELRELKARGVKVRILDVPTTLSDAPDDAIAKIFFDMVTQVLIEVMGALAESERIMIRRRQAEGIAKMKRTGKTKSGRPPGRPPVKEPKRFAEVVALVDARIITAREARSALGLTNTTYYKLLKQFRAKKNSPTNGA